MKLQPTNDTWYDARWVDVIRPQYNTVVSVVSTLVVLVRAYNLLAAGSPRPRVLLVLSGTRNELRYMNSGSKRMKRAAACVLIIVAILSTVNYIQITTQLTRRRNFTESKTIEAMMHNDKYCIAYNVTKALRSFREDKLEPISLATHTTSLYLRQLNDQMQSWDGPISLALFIDRSSSTALQFLLDLHRCEKTAAEKLSVHVVYQLSAFQSICQPLSVLKQSVPCNNFTTKYRKEFLGKLLQPFGIYPINVMRNVARRGAPSGIHILSDIEMIFSAKFATLAKKLANEHVQKDSKKIIVFRRFEIEDDVKKIPRDHKALKKLIDTGRAHEYHHKLFPIGHTIEALWEWFRRSKAKANPYVWEIPYKHSSWEPQFIMHATMPLSEEGIPTRLRDQQALAYELCRANYTFLLVSQLFNVHRGVKRVSTNFDTAVVRHQSKLRANAFKKFVSRMDSMYPNTTKRCGDFIM